MVVPTEYFSIVFKVFSASNLPKITDVTPAASNLAPERGPV